MMNKYVITYHNNMKLYDSSYIVISGKNAITALYNYYHCHFKRVYNDNKKYADIILIKGDFKNNTIMPDGAYRAYCYNKIGE